jgi:transposase
VAKACGLKSERQLRDWVKKYQAGELTAADANRRVRNISRPKAKTKFADREEEFEYLKLENEYLKKKLLLQGEPESFIANLWSSKNLK